jgi:hypothetical protein
MADDLSNFYATCAQVVPVLLLVIALETRVLTSFLVSTLSSESRRAAWVDDYGPYSRAAGVPEKVIDGAAKLEGLPVSLAGAPVWVADVWRHAPRVAVRLAIGLAFVCEALAFFALAFPPKGALQCWAVGVLLLGLLSLSALVVWGVWDAVIRAATVANEARKLTESDDGT